MSNPMNFNVAGEKYEVYLTKVTSDSSNSVSIGGVKYSVGGDAKAVEIFKEKIIKLSEEKTQINSIQDLQKLFSVETASSTNQIEGTKLLGSQILSSTKESSPTSFASHSLKTSGQRSVERELIPTFPMPGNPPISLTERMHQMGIKGVSIAVIDGGQKAWSAGYGEFEQPILIQAASISKTVTALTILSLIDDPQIKTQGGEPLSLETNIKDILMPEHAELWDSISNGIETITIRQLLAHTAGLEKDTETGFRGYYREEANFNEEEIKQLRLELQQLKDSKDSDKEEVNERIREIEAQLPRFEEDLPSLDQILKGENTNSPPVKVVNPPGKEFAYSGGGAMILQKVIEVTTKREFKDVVKERVFEKLVMNDSHFSLNEMEKANTSQGYDWDCNPLPGKWMLQPELAAAGLWTTSDDLIKLAIGIQKSLANDSEGNIIRQSSAKEMTRPFFEKETAKLIEELELIKNSDARFSEEGKQRIKELEMKLQEVPGLGVFIDQKNDTTYFFHSGSNLGFNCLMVANDKDQGAVVMTNSDFGKELYPEIIRKVADVYGWEGKESLRMFPTLHPEVLEVERDTKNWTKDYVGHYQNIDPDRSDAVLEIKELEGTFYLQTPDPDEKPFKIIPISRHLGVFQRNGLGPWIPLEFKVEKDGSILLPLGRWSHKKID